MGTVFLSLSPAHYAILQREPSRDSRQTQEVRSVEWAGRCRAGVAKATVSSGAEMTVEYRPGDRRTDGLPEGTSGHPNSGLFDVAAHSRPKLPLHQEGGLAPSTSICTLRGIHPTQAIHVAGV